MGITQIGSYRIGLDCGLIDEQRVRDARIHQTNAAATCHVAHTNISAHRHTGTA